MPARAQTPVSLYVRVIDSSGTAVLAADVAVLNGQDHTVASGLTDSTGHSTLEFFGPVGPYRLVVRRVGFHRVERTFTAAPGQTISLTITLTVAPAALAPVTVTARESAKWKSYHIGADEIAHSTRPLFDALDVVRKLRPDMLTSRAPEICADSASRPKLPGRRHSLAGGLSNIWVNGQRIRIAQTDTTWVAIPGTPAFVRPAIVEILREIRPQDIEQMTYSDCMDTSMPGLGAQNAVFITLKPGVKYERGRGTFVVARTSGSIAAPSDSAPASAPQSAPARLLGVFARATGQPLPGVSVTDLYTGLGARTSTTGTLALTFVPMGRSTICVSKQGYGDTTMAVTRSPVDTVPITVVLAAKTGGASRAPGGCTGGVASASLRGLVFSPDRAFAITGAEVSLPALGRSTTTTQRGLFNLDSLPAGHYLLAVRRLGFAPWQDSVALLAGQASTRIVQLRVPAALLDTVAVTGTRRIQLSPNLRGFEERRRAGFGHFITASELRAQEGRSLDRAIAKIPGLQAVANGMSVYLAATRAGGRRICPVSVYIDGVPMYTGAAGSSPPDFTRMYADDFAGVEFYAGGATVPPEFNLTSNDCGTLLLWTRVQ